ncbi:MAG: Arabinose operon regulatory protein [candidate division BRC1 bacterium ADurb.BinA364]|nr:MAG: Arabinose operon regulatory protein [candidate division BRC1 bacterium ADurb.BinA364]
MLLSWPWPDPEPWASVWPEAVGWVEEKRRPTQIVRSFFCIHLIERGRVFFDSSPQGEAELGPGDAFAIWPGAPFAYYFRSDAERRNSRVLWARLRGPRVAEFFRAMGFSPQSLHLRPRQPEQIRLILEELIELAAGESPAANPRAVVRLHQLIEAAAYRPASRGPAPTLASRVREFMEQELDLGLNVQQIAEAFGVSRATLFLHFRREYQASPVEILIRTRAARACVLLRETELPLSDIARRLGYRSRQYFSRQFQARQGQAPGEYREACLNGRQDAAKNGDFARPQDNP